MYSTHLIIVINIEYYQPAINMLIIIIICVKDIIGDVYTYSPLGILNIICRLVHQVLVKHLKLTNFVYLQLQLT